MEDRQVKHKTLLIAMIATVVAFLANCGPAGNTPAPVENRPAPPANTGGTATNKPAEPDKPDKPEPPATEPETELKAVPTGSLEEQGLVFAIPFERGEGSVVFSRQNDYLRVEVDVRLPYSAGDAQRLRGSSINLALSVDGKNGRHLFFYPQPVWMPMSGRPSAYRVEASYSAEEDKPRVVNNPSFVGEADVEYWDRWTSVIWIDLPHVLVPGNSPGSVADTWYAGLIVGNEAASETLPEGINRFNPGKTPDRMITLKVSELPEIDELDEDPKDRLRAREEATHTAMNKIIGQFSMRDYAGCYETAKAWLDDNPEDLWAHNLVFSLSYQIKDPKIDPDFLKYLKAYIDACPGQSSVHYMYMDMLARVDRYDEAARHAEAIFNSGLCTGRLITEGHMRLEWSKVGINWGKTADARKQIELVGANEEMLNDNELRIQYRMQLADLALREANTAEAVKLYDQIFVDESDHLDAEKTKYIQQVLNLLRPAKEQWEQELKYREADKAKTNPRLVIETSKGKIVVELFEDDAPNTTASLVSLANKQFWDGLNFHRVEPNFVIQGGCPNGDGSGGPGYRTRFERHNRKHFRGSFAMARSNDLNSQGSQFYICVSNSPSVLNLNNPQSPYLVVGRVLEGMDVADSIRAGDKIVSVKAENLRDHEYKPETIPE